MASSQSPNRVFFSNLDRSANDTTTDFTITFDTPITNSYNYEVVSASFPNLFTPFARYETILYFYHESFNNGTIAPRQRLNHPLQILKEQLISPLPLSQTKDLP